MRVWGWNPKQRAYPRGSFWTAPLLGHSRPLTTHDCNGPNYLYPYYSSRQTIFEWESSPPEKFAEKKITWPPSFMEIVQSLRESPTPQVTTNLPWETILIPNLLVGATTTTKLSAWLQQVTITGVTYIDFVTTSMSLFSLSLASMGSDCPMATLEDVTDMEDWGQLSPLLFNPANFDHF